MTTLATLLTLFLLAMLWTCFGLILTPSIMRPNRHPIHFMLGTGFILGIMVHVSALKLTNLLFPHHAQEQFLALITAEAIMIALRFRVMGEAWIEWRAFWRTPVRTPFAWIAILLFVLSPLYWLFPSSTIACNSHIGTGHTGVYANLAQVYHLLNWIPVVDIHHTQSILASSTLFLGSRQIYLAFSFWLGISTVMLLFLVFGLLHHMGLPPRSALLGCILFFFGQTALSLLSVINSDRSLSNAIISYTDDALGMGVSILLFLHFTGPWHPLRRRHLIFPVMATFFLAFTAEHWLIALLPACALLVTQRYFQRHLPTRSALLILLSLGLGSLMGITQGGLLTPARMLDRNEYFPIISNVGVSPRFSPGMPAMIRHLPWESLGPAAFDPLASNIDYSNQPLSVRIFEMEKRVWDSVRIMFFPLSGLLGILFALRIHRSNPPDDDIRSRLKQIALFTATMMVVGYMLSFFIVYVEMSYGKFSSTRFMMSGYVWGMLCLAILIHTLSRHLEHPVRVWATLLVLICTPTLHMVTGTFWNRYHFSTPEQWETIVDTWISEPTTLLSATAARPFGCHKKN